MPQRNFSHSPAKPPQIQVAARLRICGGDMKYKQALATLALAVSAGVFAPASQPFSENDPQPKPGVQAAADQREAVKRWLERSAVALKSVAAGSGFDDLQPLKQVLKDIRIVGLGEATHGTREYFLFKHRMIEFLVREMGFTVFAMEAQYVNCQAINEYVLRGGDSDDPAKVIRSNLAGVWQTEEVLALVKWIREYNKTAPEEKKVRFYGFDVQRPDGAAKVVMSYLKRVASDYAPTAQRIINETAPTGFKKLWLDYGRRTPAQKARLRARLLQLLGFLAANQTRFARMTSMAEFEEAAQGARILLKSDQIRSTPSEKDDTNDQKRDLLMADTVEYILSRERPDTRIILWAHNFHISKFHSYPEPLTRNQPAWYGLAYSRMGSYLRESFGDQFYTFGFVLDQGSFQAISEEAGAESISPDEFAVGPSPEGTAGWHLSRAGLGDFVIDLRADPGDARVIQWLTTPQLFRYIGASFSKKWAEKKFALPVVPREHFDGLIFIAKTTRAIPL